jgi:hypothetical protein
MYHAKLAAKEKASSGYEIESNKINPNEPK